MECNVMGTASSSRDYHLQLCSWRSSKSCLKNIHQVNCGVAWRLKMGSQRIAYSKFGSTGNKHVFHIPWKTYSLPLSLEVESSLQSEDYPNDDEEDTKLSAEISREPLSVDKLKDLLADPEREKLTKKLSEANQYNRFLKRQLQMKEDALTKFKSELAVMELEIQALAALVDEIAKYGIPKGSRKINGKYIQSHLLSRLNAVLGRLKEQTKDVGAAQSKKVTLLWSGMAESVQVMGSFDGWSQGEHLSPEYTGSYTRFSSELMLRPGRYEIKFLIDGEWHLSPDLPVVGEGLMVNNLLVVE